MGDHQQVKYTQLLWLLREFVINFSGHIERVKKSKRHALLTQVELDISRQVQYLSIQGQWCVLRALSIAGLKIQPAWSSDYLPDDKETVFAHIAVADAQAFLTAQQSRAQCEKQKTHKLLQPLQDSRFLKPGTVVVTLFDEVNTGSAIGPHYYLLADLALKFLHEACDRWGIGLDYHCFSLRKTPRHIARVRAVLMQYGIYLNSQNSDQVTFPQQFSSRKLTECLQCIAVIIEHALKSQRKPISRDSKTQQLYIETRASLAEFNIIRKQTQDHEPHFSNPFKI